MTAQIFISYCHKDFQALQDLQQFLKPLQREGSLLAWDDRQIKPGDNWLQAIEQAMEKTSIAILLISQDFLASDFVHNKELPYLLEKSNKARSPYSPFLSVPAQSMKR